MSLSFLGPRGGCEFHWIRFALLRDNVLHYCDAGLMSPNFSALYHASHVLGAQPVTVPALRLRDEVLCAQTLCDISIDLLAVSARTLAVLRMEQLLPPGPPTEIIGTRLTLPWLQGDLKTLGDVFGALIASLLHITEGAVESDIVEVIDT